MKNQPHTHGGDEEADDPGGGVNAVGTNFFIKVLAYAKIR